MKKSIARCSALLAIALLLSACTPTLVETTPAPLPSASATAPADTAAPTPLPSTPAATAAPTPTPVSLPSIALAPGDYYFSVDGTQNFVFSRNLSAHDKDNYNALLEWVKSCDNKFIRISLDSIGTGYTKSGGVKESWAVRWDILFDIAEAKGIYVIPVFSGWMDWNIWDGPSTWKDNPLNAANGGPVKSPEELFEKDSATQDMWLKWMQTLVQRWQGRKNILAWEIYSEVNLTTGATEPAGIDFINSAAAIIRDADPGCLVTASLADIGTWPDFYKETDLDFIQIHPYLPSARLDRAIVSEIRQHIDEYEKPVIIGECGLNAESPKKNPKNGDIGIRHSIWAGVVSGSMNGRSLFWEDCFGQYFPELGMRWLGTYSTVELPAVEFVKGIDFKGYVPLTSSSTKDVWGAAVGNESSLIGWYRDAACDPPDYAMKPVLSGQSVTITLPGEATDWRVDFYSTKDGVTLLGSVTVARSGKKITIPLPDFSDDIAFKAAAQ